MAEIIIGRNAVLEALKSDRGIDKITIAKGSEGSVRQIAAKAKDRNIPVYYTDRSKLDRETDGKSHQGVMAVVSDYKYCSIDDILETAAARNEDPFVMILDGIEDPHNLGAIMRTAECAGMHGIIIPKRRAAAVTDTVAKTSAGAIEYIRCARVTNIAATVEELQCRGLWIGACDMGGEPYYGRDMTGPVGIVVGSEGTGISRLVREKCDFTVSIPMKGKITSLNASNAASILMYEIVRQREEC